LGECTKEEAKEFEEEVGKIQDEARASVKKLSSKPATPTEVRQYIFRNPEVGNEQQLVDRVQDLRNPDGTKPVLETRISLWIDRC
jgi:hypothetical protein